MRRLGEAWPRVTGVINKTACLAAARGLALGPLPEHISSKNYWHGVIAIYVTNHRAWNAIHISNLSEVKLLPRDNHFLRSYIML